MEWVLSMLTILACLSVAYWLGFLGGRDRGVPKLDLGEEIRFRLDGRTVFVGRIRNLEMSKLYKGPGELTIRASDHSEEVEK